MKKKVAIIGAGYAGITCAVFIDHSKYDVSIYESTNHIGGRAFSYNDSKLNHILDNGQHMLMQCYHNTLKLFDKLGIQNDLYQQKKVEIPYKTSKYSYTFKATPFLPAPLHLLRSMLFDFKPLSIVERIRLLIPSITLFYPLNSSLKEMSVKKWLIGLKQSENAIKYVWEPIAIGTMNDEIDQLSAYTFKKLLKILFIESRKNSNVILARVGLSELITNHVLTFFKKRSIHIKYKSVKKLENENNKYKLILSDKSEHSYDLIISAIPYFRLNNLLSNTNLFPMKTTSIASIYFIYEGKHLFDGVFVGLPESNIQWIFNKEKLNSSYKNLYSCTISAPSDEVIQNLKNPKQFINSELDKSFDSYESSKLKEVKVIHEKRATFSDSIIDKPTRPSPGKYDKNLYICGDWTNTGLPATIEGACLSAFMMLEHFDN